MGRRPDFPRLPLLGIFALLLVVVTVTAVGHANHVQTTAPTGERVLLQRDLRFEDREDGAVVARAANDNHVVEVFQGEQGFLRGTLRSFARTRRLDELGPEAPFRLTRWSDGRLTLDDPATGQHVELVAFGPTNWGVFSRLLDAAL